MQQRPRFRRVLSVVSRHVWGRDTGENGLCSLRSHTASLGTCCLPGHHSGKCIFHIRRETLTCSLPLAKISCHRPNCL